MILVDVRRTADRLTSNRAAGVQAICGELFDYWCTSFDSPKFMQNILPNVVYLGNTKYIRLQ
jgi:hypothetical protein